jgi:hypothetical protein
MSIIVRFSINFNFLDMFLFLKSFCSISTDVDASEFKISELAGG